MVDAVFELTQKGVSLNTIGRYLDKGFSAEDLLKIDIATILNEQDKETVKEEIQLSKSVDASQFYRSGQFLHAEFGAYMVKRFGACKIGGTLHVKQGNIYTPLPEAIHGAMLSVIPDLKTAKRNEVESWLRYSPSVPKREVSPPNYIPFKSEVYDIEADKFYPYSDDFIFLNQFPVNYDPNAKDIPFVLETISTIANSSYEIMQVIFEQLGAIFYRENKYRGAPLLYGASGSNGKSTLLNLAEQMAGRENTAHLSLQDCEKRFRLLNLYGKALNAGDDIPDTVISDSSNLKKLLTGEPVADEIKGGALVEFVSYCKLWFAANTLPPISDKSNAFYSRFLIVPLDHDFSSDAGRNVDLKARRWTDEELACATKYAVDAFREVIKRGRFTIPEVVKQETELYKIENNPVLAFLSEYSIVNIPTSDAYRDFRMFCEDNGHRNIMTQGRFSRAVCNETKAKIKNARVNGKVQRCFSK